MTMFKDNKIQYIYDLYTQEPPKGRGSGLSRYYFNGLEFPLNPNLRPDSDTLAFGAWKAGVDKSKANPAMKKCIIAYKNSLGHIGVITDGIDEPEDVKVFESSEAAY